MADVAQLVEPRFVVPVVVGSSPIVRPISFFIILHLQTFEFALFLLVGAKQRLNVSVQ